MRKIIPLNYGWTVTAGKKKAETDIPFSSCDLPQNYFSHSDVRQNRVLCKTVKIDARDRGKTVIIRFEGVSVWCSLFCDGVHILDNMCPYNRFEADLSPFFADKTSAKIRLTVYADENPLVPPCGNNMDYLPFAGVYRPVSLFILEKEHIDGLSAFGKADGTFTVRLSASEETEVNLNLISPEGETVFEKTISATREENRFMFKIPNPVLWDIGEGNLYTLGASSSSDFVSIRFGFRDAEFTEDGFFINNRLVKLLGADRHQSWPYKGYAMPPSMQAQDALFIRETGLNIVRTSHYMQSTEFLDACDELGILVFEEIPGWQHIGTEPQWREQTLKNVESMIKRDFSHPCICLWGVRINESADDDELYEKTNALAGELDPYRQTGGVRNFPGSNLLEDVYTFNDFASEQSGKMLRTPSNVHEAGVPHLITEFGGHMYPTKPWDDEKHRLRHALLHAKAIDEMYGDKNIAGCICWCLFDYNTHDNFGSGDMVCYHGISDKDRIPKTAWYVYASQQDRVPVLGLSSFFDNGDWEGNRLRESAVFTNADYVCVTRESDGGTENLGTFFPARDLYPHMPHPPVFLTDLFAERLGKYGLNDAADRKRLFSLFCDLLELHPCETELVKPFASEIAYFCKKLGIGEDQLKGFMWNCFNLGDRHKSVWTVSAYKNGTLWEKNVIDPSQSPVIRADKSFAVLRHSDATFCVDEIKVVAQKESCPMRLPYFFDSLTVKTAGPVELYGSSSPVTLEGGAAGIYIRTTGTGKATVEISSNKAGTIRVDYEII